MIFERSDTKMVVNPNEQDVREGFEALGEIDMDDFVILSKNDMAYIQAAIGEGEEDGFILEYQDGSLDRHYVASNRDIPQEEILKAFLAYLTGDESWKSNYLWETADMGEE